MAGPNVSSLSTSLVEKGPELFKKRVNELDLTEAGIQVYKYVSKPIALPKISASGNPRPYRTADDFTDGAAYSDRTLTVYQSKWDIQIDPEQYRNTYMNLYAGNPAAPEKYEHILDQVTKEYFASIHDSVIYEGLYNASGSTAAAIADGFEKLIGDAKVANPTMVVTTGAIGSSDAVTKVETFLAGLPTWMLKKGVNIYCSLGVWRNYIAHYRTLNSYSFQPNVQGQYIIDGFSNVKLKWLSWLPAASDILIATPDGNLIMGTDSNGVEVHATPHLNIINIRLLMPIGFQIADIEAMYVNDQS